ncbi:hypothetical protein F4695_003883 [Rhizobium soli]|uniref:Uncharacterized protein n=1 Tax=Rhizobium soli TaxID=424798 RepID=A0A7X0JPG3_9HYPH|nr:hypothetical protein [Rhizobium soli]
MRDSDDVAARKAEAQSCRHNTDLFDESEPSKKALISGIRNFGHILVSKIVWVASMCAVIVAGSLLILD